jgi:hypothetical protein
MVILTELAGARVTKLKSIYTFCLLYREVELICSLK